MNDRIETLLAKQEIYELACRYSRGLDRLDAEHRQALRRLGQRLSRA